MNFARLGATLAGIGVVLGAFGAHGLQGKISPDFLEIYKTSTYYLVLHSVALLLFEFSSIRKRWPGWCFVAGIAFFSGSLYALVFTGVRKLGAITPIGGVLFILGWIGFAALLPKLPFATHSPPSAKRGAQKERSEDR
jgi:uncharacterized membrane protein YgdD (TMEM256/DUF423 family)